MVAALVGAGLDDRALVAESGGGRAEVSPEMVEGLAAEGPHLDVLEGVPDALRRVEVRGVGGEWPRADALRSARGQEVLDRPAAMDRRAVPDDPELAGDGPEPVLAAADDGRALVGARLHEQRPPPRRGDAADGRGVIVRQRQAQGRGPPAGGVGPDGAGGQIGGGLVDPDDGPSLPVSPLPRAGRRAAYQASIAASSRRPARSTGLRTLRPAARRSLPT